MLQLEHYSTFHTIEALNRQTTNKKSIKNEADDAENLNSSVKRNIHTDLLHDLDLSEKSN